MEASNATASTTIESVATDVSVATEDETEEVVKDPIKPKETVSVGNDHYTVQAKVNCSFIVKQPKGSAKLKPDTKAKSTPKPTPSTPKAAASANKSLPRKSSVEKVNDSVPNAATTEEPVTSRSGRTIKPKR